MKSYPVDQAPLWECFHILGPEEQNREGGGGRLGCAPLTHTLSDTCVDLSHHHICTRTHSVEVGGRVLVLFSIFPLKVKIMRKFCRYQLVCTHVLSHAVGPPALLQATTPCLWKLPTRSGGPGGRLSGILTAFWHSTLPPVLCCSALSEKGLLKRGICEHQEGRTGQESTLGGIETFLSNSFDRKSLFYRNTKTAMLFM